MKHLIKTFKIAFFIGIVIVPFFIEANELTEEVAGGFSFVSSAIGDEKRYKVDGDSARFRPDGYIEIDGVKAEIFGNNEEKYYFFTDRARINKQFNRIYSDEKITIVHGDTVITGVGLEWLADRKVAVIKKDVKVIFTKTKGKELLR